MRDIICFHNPDEINGYLSNWYLSEFEINGIRYSSMEQYMMYQKAVLFNDSDIAGQILQTSNVGKIKALGRAVKNYNEKRKYAELTSFNVSYVHVLQAYLYVTVKESDRDAQLHQVGLICLCIKSEDVGLS